MTNKKMIYLVRANSGGIDGATDAQVLVMAKALPAGTLEKYEQKEKVKKDNASSQRP